MRSSQVMQRALAILSAEAEAIKQIQIGREFVTATRIVMACKGKVIVTGMGKVGYVGRRLAATLSSTGTPAVFIHPAEAAHGDLGLLACDDLLIAISNSGRTREVLEMADGAKRRIPSLLTLVVTGNITSPLAKKGDRILCYGKIKEPCPLGLTPTASIAALSALLDALALCVMEWKGFTAEDYAQRHHSGYLGKQARKMALLQYGSI